MLRSIVISVVLGFLFGTILWASCPPYYGNGYWVAQSCWLDNDCSYAYGEVCRDDSCQEVLGEGPYTYAKFCIVWLYCNNCIYTGCMRGRC